MAFPSPLFETALELFSPPRKLSYRQRRPTSRPTARPASPEAFSLYPLPEAGAHPEAQSHPDPGFHRICPCSAKGPGWILVQHAILEYTMKRWEFPNQVTGRQRHQAFNRQLPWGGAVSGNHFDRGGQHDFRNEPCTPNQACGVSTTKGSPTLQFFDAPKRASVRNPRAASAKFPLLTRPLRVGVARHSPGPAPPEVVPSGDWHHHLVPTRHAQSREKVRSRHGQRAADRCAARR